MTPREVMPARVLAFLLLLPLTAWGFSVAWQHEPAPRAARAQQSAAQVDPAAWGGDHVGKMVPEYMTGDECLFCHRKNIGPSWSKNPHQTTIRPVERTRAEWKALASEPAAREMAQMVEFILGGDHHSRYLRRGKGYGKLEMLSVGWNGMADGGRGMLVHATKPAWNAVEFGKACAGCHATGVDSKKQAFSAISIDCFACHGTVELEHAKDTRLVHLSKKRADAPRVVASICGQCHIRHGQSRSTGLPFANNFVAGDNLFRDLAVDFDPGAVARMDPGDRHVMHNIREMILQPESPVTCLSCHDVHGQSTGRHQDLDDQDLCSVCHVPGEPRSRVKSYRRQSRTCGY